MRAMRWEMILALIIAIPLILFPAAYVWYMNLRRYLCGRQGVHGQAGRPARNRRKWPLTEMRLARSGAEAYRPGR